MSRRHVLYAVSESDGQLALADAEWWTAFVHDYTVLSQASTLGELRDEGLTILASWVLSMVEDDEAERVRPEEAAVEAWRVAGFSDARAFACYTDDHQWDGDAFIESWWDSGVVPWDAEFIAEQVPVKLRDYGRVSGASPGGNIDGFIPDDLDRFLAALHEAEVDPVRDQALFDFFFV